jgi:pyrroloquinoline quinone (PQQ) biosynthesis protein C
MPFFEQLAVSTATNRDEMIGIPVIQRALNGDVTHQEYLDYLGQAYHHVKHTVPLLMACGSRLPETKNWLRAALAKYIEEEIGHEEWILDDIAAAGGNANAVRNSLPQPATELMVSYAYDTIQRRNPAGFFGMVYVLEGTSVNLAHRTAEAIRHKLELPKTAFRYLTSHGSVDQDHIVFLETLVNRLDDPSDQDQVVHCARMFFRLYGDVFRSVDHQPSTSGELN